MLNDVFLVAQSTHKALCARRTMAIAHALYAKYPHNFPLGKAGQCAKSIRIRPTKVDG